MCYFKTSISLESLDFAIYCNASQHGIGNKQMHKTKGGNEVDLKPKKEAIRHEFPSIDHVSRFTTI